jgi:hypothetical protein
MATMEQVAAAEARQLYTLKLHESFMLKSSYCLVTRVPGGWIYMMPPVNDVNTTTSVFVPYHNEFQGDYQSGN